MAASLRAAATRILRPAGQGLRRLVHTQEHSGSTRALEEGYPTAEIQQKKEELYDLIADAYANSTTSQADRYVLKGVLKREALERAKLVEPRRIKRKLQKQVE